MFAVITFTKKHSGYSKFMISESKFITDCTGIKLLKHKNMIQVHKLVGNEPTWTEYDKSIIDNITLSEIS